MSASIMRVNAAIPARTGVRTGVARAVVILALAAGACAGLAIGANARGGAGDVELTHLLRAMAVLKLMFVGAVAGATLWRLQAPVTPYRLAAYAALSVPMAMGPGLIWFLAYIGAASILLHGGVAGAALLLWRDPASSQLLDAALAQRRLRVRAQS